MQSKGVSPLIAAVILIALVVAVVGISSTFFTGFAKEQKESVKSKSSSMLECGMAQMEIDKNLVSSSVGKVSVGIENIGMTDLTGLKIVIYNETGAFELPTSPNTLDISEIKMLYGTYYGDFIFNKISVTCTQCPGIEDSVSLTFSYQEDGYEENCTSGGYGNLTDGNWSSSEFMGVGSSCDVNYTKSAGTIGAIWQVYDSSPATCNPYVYTGNMIRNVTIPDSCWNAHPTKLLLNMDEPGGDLFWKCYNGTEWIVILNTCDGSSHMFEEAIYWNVVDS